MWRSNAKPHIEDRRTVDTCVWNCFSKCFFVEHENILREKVQLSVLFIPVRISNIILTFVRLTWYQYLD